MKVIIHCSGSRWGNAAIIAKWHTVGRGWSNIGYHRVILNGHLSSKAYDAKFDGHTETGRPLDSDNLLESFEYGAHVRGLNDESIGICLIGESGNFTAKQLQELEQNLISLRQKFKNLEISQHSDWDKNKPYCAGLSQDYIDKLNELYG